MKNPEVDKTLKKSLDLWLPWKIQNDHVPGIVVYVSRDGKPIYNTAFGHANVEKGTAMNSSTLFRVASMSKMFTAVAIMQLVEKKKITLQTRVSKIIKEFDTDALRIITIKNVLQHRAGIFRDSGKNYWNENMFTDDVLLDVTISTKVIDRDVDFKYSNFGFSILGKIIEAVTGKTYFEYVNEHIIQKLNLKDTYPDYDASLESRLAVGYSRNLFNEKRYSFSHSKTQEYAPATGFVSTVADISLFLSDIWGTKSKLLNKESKKILAASFKKVYSSLSYGFGFEREVICGEETFGHGGGYDGYITRSFYMPKEKLSVIVFTNCLGGSADLFAKNIVRLIHWLKAIKPIEKRTNTEKYEGIYRDVSTDDCIVGAAGNLLSFNPTVRKPFDAKTYLYPVGPDTFEIKSSDRFGSVGEKVVFTDFKNTKAQKILWAGSIENRIL